MNTCVVVKFCCALFITIVLAKIKIHTLTFVVLQKERNDKKINNEGMKKEKGEKIIIIKINERDRDGRSKVKGKW